MKKFSGNNLEQKLTEIKLLMQYAVPAEKLEQATGFVVDLRCDVIGLNLCHHFYSFLPEPEDDYIKSIALVARREGTFLLLARTGLAAYLYLVSQEKTEFVSRADEKEFSRELLDFFGYRDSAALSRQLSSSDMPADYIPSCRDENICPSCQVEHGEFHILGCPLEICPWCDGQLTSCNCRFTQLDRDQVRQVKDIEEFSRKLTAKGRIPFNRKERLAFPALADDQESNPE